MCLIIFKKYMIFLYIFLYILEKIKFKKRLFENEFFEKIVIFINFGFIYLINVV